MLIGYMRVSNAAKPKNGEELKATRDQAQNFDLQMDALLKAGIEPGNIYEDRASGKKDDRPGLAACLKALRQGDVLVVWRLDRLGRNLKHLIETVDDLGKRGIGFQCLTGLAVDTTTPTGRFMLQVFGGLAEFERELIRERVMAGLNAARTRGRKGGRRHVFTPAKLGIAQASMKSRDPNTSVATLCKEIGVSTSTLYAHIGPTGELTERGKALLHV